MEQKIPWFLSHSNPEQIYTTADHLVLDFETDNLDRGSPLNEENDIVLACWSVVSEGNIVKVGSTWGGVYEQQELLDDIQGVSFIVAQNLKFELQWLKRCGLELHDVLGYDTMLAEWVMDGNKKDPRNLEALARKYGVPGKVDQIGALVKAGVSVRDINPRWLEEYCHQDVAATRQVFLKQQRRLSLRKQWHLVHTRNLTCSVLADIEFEGLSLDSERVQEEWLKATEIKERLGAELATLSGGINLGSPKQLGTFLYDTLGLMEATDHRGEKLKTKGGDRSAAAPTLLKLKAKTQKQKEFLTLYKEYNKQVSLLEKNLDYFKLTCEQKEGKCYANFQQNVVQTHRLSCVGIPVKFKGLKKAKSVQFQNIPREYKRLFWSGDDDWVVRDDDGSQLEFRVAVEEGRDKTGRYEIETGVDVHSFTAKVMTEAGEPTERQEAKAMTFRPLFGGGAGSRALQAYCEYFKDKYKGISYTQRNWALKCVDKKQFTTPYGMVFYFPKAKMNRSGYVTDSTLIYNYPIQGFATGEIIPLAMVYFWHRTRHLRCKIMVTVHDSVASKVHKDDVEATDAIAKQAFTYDVYEHLSRVYKYSFTVPLGLESKHGTHWGEGKGTKTDVWPDGREERR